MTKMSDDDRYDLVSDLTYNIVSCCFPSVLNTPDYDKCAFVISSALDCVTNLKLIALARLFGISRF